MESEELRLVNAFYGFCVQGDDWPSPLAELGYRPCGVEREIRVVLDGTDRTVVPDFICASAMGQHAICLEAKSKTVHPDQAARYKAIRPSSLLNTGNLPAEIDPPQLTHDTVYAAARENAQSVAAQLMRFGVPFPVIAADELRFELESGVISRREIQQLFAASIDVSASIWPLHYVPFNSNSSVGEMAPFVSNAVAEFIIKGQNFSGDDVAARATPHWVQCGSKERQAIRDKVVQLLNTAVANELQGYLIRLGLQRFWNVSYRPFGFQALARLSRLLAEFVDRTVAGRPPVALATQLQLFPDESDEQNIEEEVDEDENGGEM